VRVYGNTREGQLETIITIQGDQPKQQTNEIVVFLTKQANRKFETARRGTASGGGKAATYTLENVD